MECNVPTLGHVALTFPEPDTLLSNSTDDSFRAQLCLVNQCIYEVQRVFHKLKEELGEGSSVRSPFVQEIQDRPIPLNFYHSNLEAYNGCTNLVEHVATIRA